MIQKGGTVVEKLAVEDNYVIDQNQEDELLMHVAAGTDLFTAMAALPREEVPPKESVSTADQWWSAIAWAVLAGIGFAARFLLF